MKMKIVTVAALFAIITSCGKQEKENQAEIKSQFFLTQSQSKTKEIQEYAEKRLELCEDKESIPSNAIGCTSWGTIGEVLKASGYILEDIGLTKSNLKTTIIDLHKKGFSNGLLAGTTQLVVLPLNVSGQALGLAYKSLDTGTVAIINITENSLSTLNNVIKGLDSVAAKTEVGLFRVPFLLATASVKTTADSINLLGSSVRVAVGLTTLGVVSSINIATKATVLIFKKAGQGLTAVWNLTKKITTHPSNIKK